MKHLFFIGAGPGHPQMLTLQGRDSLIQSASVFLLSPYEESFAELLQGKNLFNPFAFDYTELLARLEEQLETGDVAFLIPGDLAFYAPFQGLIDHFGQRSIVIPGVGVANAAAAVLKRTLDLPDVCQQAVIVSPRTLPGDKSAMLEKLARPGVTLLIYMNIFSLEELVAILRRGYGRDEPIALLHRLSLPGEQVILATLDTLPAECSGHDFFQRQGAGTSSLTLLIAGESLTATVDGRWWDSKRATSWKDTEL